MSKIIIADGQTSKILDHIHKYDVIDNAHERDMSNWVEVFEFTAFADKRYAQHLVDRNRLIIPDEDGEYRELIIKNTERYSGTEGVNYINIISYGFYQDLVTAKTIEPGTTPSQSPEAHMRDILDGTEVRVGEVAYTGNIRTITRENKTDPFSALKSLANEFDLELDFRIEVDRGKIVRYADLVEHIGEWRGRTVEFGHDLQTVSRKTDANNIVTALRVIGPEREDGTRLEVFVEDEDARNRWSRNGEHLVREYEPETENQNITEERLRTLGRTELNKRVNALVTWEINVIDLEHVPGMQNKKIRYGDTIRVKDTTFNPPFYVEARIFKQRRNIFNPGSKQVELGDFREYTVEEVRQNWQTIKEELEEKIRRAEIRAGFGDIKFTIISYKSPLQTAKAGYDSQYNSLYDNPDLEASIRGTLSYAKANYDAAYNALVNTIDVKADLETLSDADLAEVNALYADYEKELAVLKTNFELATDAIGQTKSDRTEDKANDYTDQRMIDINLELDDARKNIDEARKNLDETNDRLDNAVVDLDEARDNIEDTKDRLADLDRDLEDARNQLNDKVDFTDYNARIREITDDMADKVDGEWVDGRLRVEIDGESELIYVKDDIDGMFNNTVSKAKYETDQEGYVNRFKDYETNVEQTWDEINARLKSTDYNTDKNQLEERLATWEATAEGFEQTVSEVRADLDNLEIGGKNLAALSDFASWSGGYTLSDYVFTITNKTQAGIRINKSIFEIGKEYVLSFKIKKLNGNLVSIAGHRTAFSDKGVYIDGEKVSTNWSSSNPLPNDNESHSVEVHLKFNGNQTDDNLYIQPNRTGYAHTYSAEIWDVQVEEGNRKTSYSPSYKDAFTYTETRVKQLSDEWSTTYIKNDEVIAGIRVGDSERIGGANVEITGDTAIYGELTAPDAVFKKITVDDAYIINSEIENMTITGTQNTENAIFQRGEFRKIFIDEAEIDKATILDSDLEDVRITGEMTAGEIRGVDIYGGSITSGSTIDITTDLRVGRNIYLYPTSSTGRKTIDFFEGGSFISSYYKTEGGLSRNNIDIVAAGTSGIVNINATNIRMQGTNLIEFTGQSSISSIDMTGGVARWRQSPDNYIYQSDSLIQFYQGAQRLARFDLQDTSTRNARLLMGGITLKFLSSGSQLQVRNQGDTAYAALTASSVTETSSEKWKTNIDKYEGSALELINQSVLYEYDKEGVDRREIGLIIERETPQEVIGVGNESVRPYVMSSIAWKAIQELDSDLRKIDLKFEDEISWLKTENQLLKNELKKQKYRIEQLEELVA